MGETTGQVRLKPDDKVYLPWNTWLKKNHPEEHHKAINATGPKQNILNTTQQLIKSAQEIINKNFSDKKIISDVLDEEISKTVN